MDKKQRALELSEELLEEIELRKIDDHSTILKCLSIARLIGDTSSVQWLQFELGGYTDTDKGIPEPAWSIACQHGRKYIKNEKPYIFTELASELVSKIEASKLAIGSFSTAGASVSGEWAMGAMSNLTSTVSHATADMRNDISRNERRLSILRGQYYDYVLRVSIELRFSNKVSEIFNIYKQEVDIKMLEISSDAIKKLSAIEENLNSDNPESYSQVLTTCRRLFGDISNYLFTKYYPKFEGKTYTTKSGKGISIAGDNYLNKLSAVIEKLEDKSPSKSLIGSQIIFMIDWIENLNNMQCKGVHSDISKDEAVRCIIHTYICLGDILKMQA
jgi:hypothetical protein